MNHITNESVHYFLIHVYNVKMLQSLLIHVKCFFFCYFNREVQSAKAVFQLRPAHNIYKTPHTYKLTDTCLQ